MIGYCHQGGAAWHVNIWLAHLNIKAHPVIMYTEAWIIPLGTLPGYY